MRRSIFKSSILLLCGLASAFICLSSYAAAKKPNILYIMSDDHAAHAIGAYGGRLSGLNPTPTLDLLAQQGTLFTRVFTTNSICTPSRASVLTGQYSQTNGVLDLFGSLPSEQQYLPQAMKKAGYQTAIIGKWHLKQEPGAFDYYKVLASQGTYFDPEFRVRGPKPWPKNTVTYRGHSSDIIANQGLDWLYNERDKSKPFMLMLQFKAPHDMFEYAPQYEYYLHDTTIPEPTDLYQRTETFGSIATRGENGALESVIGTSVSKRNFRRNMGQHMGVSQDLDDTAYTKESYQRYLKAYLRCVKGVDDNIARVITELKKMGEWDNTVIIYTADQGFMLGEHDFIDKRWMYDESMRMPFIVRYPGKEKAPGKSDLLINNTDFAPFIIDIAGGKIPAQMQGKSFASVLDGKTPKNWRTATYYRYWMHRAHHDVPAHFGIRDERYKLILFYGVHYEENAPEFYDRKFVQGGGENRVAVSTPAAWELYDLKNDPNELNNVYGDKKYADVVVKLKKELIRQRKLYNETDKNYPHIDKVVKAAWNH